MVRVFNIDIDHHIPHFRAGLQLLRGNVDVPIRKYPVDLRKDTRHVAMHVQKPVFSRVGRQGDFREVDR